MNDTFPSTDDIDDADPWAEWPESDLEIDDDAFAEAIAQGRTLDAAA